jgi:hypothetical protein
MLNDIQQEEAANMESIYREEMKNVGYKVAMKAIRRIVRDSKTNDTAKLNSIMSIIHDFEEDLKDGSEK